MKYTAKSKKLKIFGSLKITSSRAQMEMMGLAVIVILLAIGMFFVVRFTIGKEPVTLQPYQQRQVGTGFVNTLLSTNAGCAGSSANFAKVLDELTAPGYSILRCGDPGTALADYFNESVSSILNETLYVWGYKYELDIIFPKAAQTSPGQITISQGCEGSTQQEAAPPFPIPTDYGDIMVVMKICY